MIPPFTDKTPAINARFFRSIDQVPTQAIFMGIDTIMNSREILLLISGEAKAEAMERLMDCNTSREFPASVLKRHDQVTVIVDEAALVKVKDKIQGCEEVVWF